MKIKNIFVLVGINLAFWGVLGGSLYFLSGDHHPVAEKDAQHVIADVSLEICDKECRECKYIPNIAQCIRLCVADKYQILNTPEVQKKLRDVNR